jgi:hypothetical protein
LRLFGSHVVVHCEIKLLKIIINERRKWKLMITGGMLETKRGSCLAINRVLKR